MEKNTRRKIFYLFGFIFLVAAPLLIAYSLGYTLDITNRTIEKTGGIFIKSYTPRVSILLNGALVRDTSLLSGSALLTNLTPDRYELKIEKEGYHSWVRTVTVKPEFVTEFKSILLVPDPLPAATSSAKEVAALKSASSTVEYGMRNAKNELITRADGKVLLKQVRYFKTIEDVIFAITEKGFLVRINPQTREMQTIGNPGFYMNARPFKFIGSDTGDAAIIDSSGGVFGVTGDTVTPLAGDTENAVFDAKSKKLLLIKTNTIEAVWIKENTSQPFQKYGTVEVLISGNEKIIDAFWFGKDQAHVIFRTKNGIYLTELDGRGGPNTTALASDKTDSLFVPAQEINVAFFKKDKTWYKIEL